jgi:hypothetical protein
VGRQSDYGPIRLTRRICGPRMRQVTSGETATVYGVLASAEYEADAQSQPTLLDPTMGLHPEARARTSLAVEHHS